MFCMISARSNRQVATSSGVYWQFLNIFSYSPPAALHLCTSSCRLAPNPVSPPPSSSMPANSSSTWSTSSSLFCSSIISSYYSPTPTPCPCPCPLPLTSCSCLSPLPVVFLGDTHLLLILTTIKNHMCKVSHLLQTSVSFEIRVRHQRFFILVYALSHQK